MPTLKNAKDMVKKYNKAMVDVNAQYSVVEAINEMVQNIDVSNVKNGSTSEIKVDGKTTKMGTKEAVSEVQKAFGELAETTKKAREGVFKKIVAVGHMAGMPGSMWGEAPAEVQAKPKPENSKISVLDEVQSRIVPWAVIPAEIKAILESKDLNEQEIGAIVESINCKVS
jgi:hypothetical protein